MAYDNASWHSDGDFPPNSPDEYGGTHIALFLKWCFRKGWAGDMHLEYEPEDTQKVMDGSMPATDYFFKYCDGKFSDQDLNEEGNRFAEKYYGEDGLYFDDFAELFAELMYEAPEEAYNYSKLEAVLDYRLRSGILTQTQEAFHR